MPYMGRRLSEERQRRYRSLFMEALAKSGEFKRVHLSQHGEVIATDYSGNSIKFTKAVGFEYSERALSVLEEK